ncbi:hypothetical protein MSG28_015415 [Choristoneura fumiferana]|uniref:Uncharacterized protein n=1 Tax=Choristoneura fumiferana TaxID=7141 RepID=A0ACC0KAJ0_CHOFU|nr:hypothetical protein MSG28_015415 [Choristoneura fumiferana]
MEDSNICSSQRRFPYTQNGSRQNPSAVDLSLCSPNFSSLLSWSVLQDSHGKAWKKQVVIPLAKPGKDPLLPSSHRPIALSSCLLKILEHMIKKRLEWFVESKKILARSQFGFRRGMGTMDSLSILTTDIRITLSRNEFLIDLFGLDPGSFRNPGNEIADALAKEAIETGSLDHPHCYFYDLLSSAKSDLDSSWLRQYERSILGEKYDGRRADVWSCGVILYALLVGALPFDDDNLRQLLEKVKRGVFHVPHFVPPDCQQLLRGMIEVNPEKRMTLAEITRHGWVTAGGRGELEQELPMMEVVQTRVLPNAEAVDPDVLQAICSLGCFKQRDKLIQELLSPHHNTEKVIYFLLLERKRRRPARDDEPRPSAPAPPADPPRKRLDTCRVSREMERVRSTDRQPILDRLVKDRQSRPGVLNLGCPLSGKSGKLKVVRDNQGNLLEIQKVRENTRDFPKQLDILTPVVPVLGDVLNSGTIKTANEKVSTFGVQSASSRREGRSSPQLPASPPTGHTPHRVSSLGGTPATPGSPLASPSIREHHHQRANSTGPTISLNISGEPGEAVIIINESPLHSSNVPVRPHSPSQSHRVRERSSLPGPPTAQAPTPPSLFPNLGAITGAAGGSGAAAPWRARLATIKNSFLGSPRFHRRKMQTSSEEVHLTPESSPELTKRSWFGSLLLSADKEETFTALVKGKPLATVKADLIHAFLSIAELSHSVLSPMSFRVEYKRGSNAPAMFQRHVRFQVDISTITKAPGENGKEYLYAITFTLLSGNIRRFRRVCEVVQAAVCRAPGASRAPPHHPPSPRAARRHIPPHPANEIPDSPETPQLESDEAAFEAGKSPTPTSHTSIDQLDQCVRAAGACVPAPTGAHTFKPRDVLLFVVSLVLFYYGNSNVAGKNIFFVSKSVRLPTMALVPPPTMSEKRVERNGTHTLGSSSSVTSGSSGYKQSVRRRRVDREPASASLDHEIMSCPRELPGTHTKRSSSEHRESLDSRSLKDELRRNNSLRDRREVQRDPHVHAA